MTGLNTARAQPVVAIEAGPAIDTAGLTKRFGEQVVVNDVDLLVPTGAVYGFLGPNGSGKTTTIRMLLGLISATAGEANVLGHSVPKDCGKALPRVGALIEGPAFHPYLSGRENLLRLDAADATSEASSAVRRAEAALDRVGLLATHRKRYRAYSLGMRQRLAIAATFLRPRDLLVLDEPTNGLDPQGTREVRQLIGQLAHDGTTVFVSSHLLAEVEQMCSHLGVMRQGKLVAQGTVEDLRDRTHPDVVLMTGAPEVALDVLRGLGLGDVRREGDSVVAALGSRPPEPVVDALVHGGVGVRSFVVRNPSLEDLYVTLTGEGFDVSG